MIRTSKHSTKFTNPTKLGSLENFIQEYKDSVEFYIDYLWNQYSKNVNLSVPRMISTKSLFPIGTKLSKRALKCASDQACGIVRSVLGKSRKLNFIINKLRNERKDTKYLKSKLNKLKFSKPILSNDFSCELNSICCDLKIEENFMFLQLKSIGKAYGKIRIPLKQHKQSLKWKNKGKILNGFLVNNKTISIRYEIEEKFKTEGIIVGADQGLTTCLTLSDGQSTFKDKDGWDLQKIVKKLSRKKKGSKSFKKTQEHRKNYINWSINQLDFKNIKQINLEKLKDVRLGRRTSRNLSHWNYSLIKSKILRATQEQEVLVKEQSSIFRSQRCSECGLVCKDNRKGKKFKCLACKVEIDSDFNASKNHEIELPNLKDLQFQKLNIKGFYWLESGIFDLEGKELTVPCANKR